MAFVGLCSVLVGRCHRYLSLVLFFLVFPSAFLLILVFGLVFFSDLWFGLFLSLPRSPLLCSSSLFLSFFCPPLGPLPHPRIPLYLMSGGSNPFSLMSDEEAGGSDSIVLEEEIDPNYVPTAEEVSFCLCILSSLPSPWPCLV